MVKAATKTDVKNINKRIDELSECMTRMTNHMKDYSQWLAYRTILDTFKDCPNLITVTLARECLENAKGHVTNVLFKRYFKKIGLEGF